MGLRKQDGFSLMEMMITVSIIMILCAVTFVSMMPMLNQSHVDSAYDTTLMALRNTRNLAITQSHEYYVNFNPAGFPAGTIQVQYQPPNVGGVAQPLQQVITYTIPVDVSFAVKAGFPASAPDGFGTGAAPIDFGQGLGGGSLNYVVFMPDGSSQDNLGNFNNGVLYMTRPNDTTPNNSRAVSVWGATGRIRGWRSSQIAGVWTWVQQ
jgi:prepilin-type N-terminal cleavage/methylation domain-containing protein